MTWRRLRVARGLCGRCPPRLVRFVGRQQPHHQPHQRACRQHQHQRAVVLTARKLVRLVVRLLTTNEPYQARRAAAA